MKLLVTGGCGFIGSNYIRYVLEKRPDVEVINLDALTYAGNLENLKDLENHPRYRFVKGSIADPATVEKVFAEAIDGVVNFAAESHVDRSILDARAFIETNVLGTQLLLDAARKHKVERFLQVSTDEVYGELGQSGFFTESTPLAPRSPYSASKASADHLVMAAYTTFGLPVLITRCCNNYGPYQFPEKLIPLMIINALHDKPLPVYGKGENVRDWIYVLDHCSAVDAVFFEGEPGQVYNVGARCEKQNIEVVKTLLKLLNKPETLITYVEDRPGHDLRYAIDPVRLEKEIGWSPDYAFETALEETVQWYLTREGWWRNIISGAYQDYYQEQYGKRNG